MNRTSPRNIFILAGILADQVFKFSDNFSQKIDSYFSYITHISPTHSSLFYLFTYYFKTWTQKLLREKNVLRFQLPSFLMVLLVSNRSFHIFLFL